MILSLSARKCVLVFLAACALAGPAGAVQRQPTGRCAAGQAEIKPLEPLTIVTGAGPKRLMVEVARTERQRETGMMCRTSMANDRGMLFQFPNVQPVAFWMRNTLIPLDIVYIRPTGEILSIARNARPLDESLIPAGGPVNGVLELRGGRAAELGLLPGDRVEHRMFQAR